MNEHIGAVEFRHEARFHGHRVHELHAAGEAFDVYQLFTDLFGHIGEIGNRRDDPNGLCFDSRAHSR